MEDQSLSPIQIRVAVFILKKHKWKIIVLFLSTVITVAIGSLMATPMYQASAKLLVKPGREDIYVSPAGDSSTLVDRSDRTQKINSEIAIIKSSSVSKKLVERMGVNRLYAYPDRTLRSKLFKKKNEREIPSAEKALESVLDRLHASVSSDSNVIDVTFEWPDPFIAVIVLNHLIELYFDHHLKVHTNPQTYTLLQEQASKWETRLRESEARLQEFKSRHAITSLPQQRTILLGRLSEAETQKKGTETELHEKIRLVGTLNDELSKLDQKVQLQETVNTTSSALQSLKAKLVELELQGLKDEISRVKEMIAEEEKKEQKVIVTGKSPVQQGIESDFLRAKTQIEALKARLKTQENQVAGYREQLETLDGLENQMGELEREVAINETNYKLYLTKFEESKISESMDKQKIANVKIIEPAVLDMEPVKPKKRLNVMMGGFLGLFAGIGLAFLIEFLNPVFRTREDVEHYLGFPVLATIPKAK